MKQKYMLRYWFEWRGPCFWSADARTRERFGYAIRPEALPLRPETMQRVNALIHWHDQALNWEYPPDPGPWRQDECDRFNQAARNLLETARKELAEDFEMIDAFHALVEDPDLDVYLQDPQGFERKT